VVVLLSVVKSYGRVSTRLTRSMVTATAATDVRCDGHARACHPTVHALAVWQRRPRRHGKASGLVAIPCRMAVCRRLARRRGRSRGRQDGASQMATVTLRGGGGAATDLDTLIREFDLVRHANASMVV
jgi:hypothetical protein